MEISPTTFILGLSALAALMLVGLVLARNKKQRDGADELVGWDDAGTLLAMSGFTQLDVETWTKDTGLVREPLGVKLRKSGDEIYAWIEATWPGAFIDQFRGLRTRFTVGALTPPTEEPSGAPVQREPSESNDEEADSRLRRWVSGDGGERLMGLPKDAVVFIKAPAKNDECFEIGVAIPFKSPYDVRVAARAVERLLQLAIGK